MRIGEFVVIQLRDAPHDRSRTVVGYVGDIGFDVLAADRVLTIVTNDTGRTTRVYMGDIESLSNHGAERVAG